MKLTRQAALDAVRGFRLNATKRLVEQGPRAAEVSADVPSAQDKDIDFWAASADRHVVEKLLTEFGAVKVATSSRRVWLNHDVYVVSCVDGVLLLDVKFGDLKVGPLGLLTEAELLASLDRNARFSGVAQITDLIVRRLARGKTVDPARLDEARSAWQEMGPDERRKADQHFARRFGARTGASILDLLEGREPPESVGRALRMQVCGACLISFSGMTTAASKIVSGAAGWLTRRPRPFGQYVTGAVVVISGTDGVGKSTTLENVANELQAHGMRCTTVYLGRGRGNVPGVATLRDLVSRKVLKGHAAKDVYRKPTVNKLASWLYAFEYFLRTLWPRFLVRFPGHVVLCDRYCYDIGLIPGASTWAIRFARFLCPRPAMNVLLQAPPDVILQRKAERSLEEIQKQQAVLSRIIENRYARQISMTIDTSETDITGTCDKIAGSIYQLTHRDFT